MALQNLIGRNIVLAAIGIFALGCTGCVRSVQPVLKDEQCITDNSLVGRWVTKDNDQVDCRVKDAAAKTYSILYTDHEHKTGAFVGRLGKVGKLTLIEITPEYPAPTASDAYKAHLLPLYSFLSVKQASPQLELLLLSPDWMKKYLDANPGELAVFRPNADDVIITASTEELQRFLTKHADEEGVWTDQATLVRPGDPTTRPAATEPAGK